jgi:hypothetical protein
MSFIFFSCLTASGFLGFGFSFEVVSVLRQALSIPKCSELYWLRSTFTAPICNWQSVREQRLEHPFHK